MESFNTSETGPVKKPRGFVIKLMVGLALLGLLAVACLGTAAYLAWSRFGDSTETVTLAISKLTEQPVLNQIAFVGNDKNVWLVSPDGQLRRHITTDSKGYHFPTWSPDGRYLAFIGPAQKDNPALYVSPTAENLPAILFESAESAPFYLYWAPDSQMITFLTQESAGLAMRQTDINTPGAQRILGEGSPFYWVWSPTSEKLLMHVGGSRALSNQAHISILENQAEAERIELDLAPGGFQAPVWSADGHDFYYIARDQGRDAIYKTDAQTLEQTVVIKLKGFAYMVLSPNNNHIAYSQIERNSRPPFGIPYIVDTDGQNNRRLMEGVVGSMYWSPDGTKLALLALGRREDGSTAKAGGLAAPLPQEIVFRWWVYDVKTEALEALTSFNPTVEFLQTVPYFDQYHLSLTFWSPDSRYFVITKESQERDNEGTVWILDTTGQEEPRQVGEGTLAVWSWQ